MAQRTISKLEIALNHRKSAYMTMTTTEINKKTSYLCIIKVEVQFVLRSFLQKKKKKVSNTDLNNCKANRYPKKYQRTVNICFLHELLY